MHPILSTSIPDNPTLFENLSYQFNGLVIVFTALCAIWAATALVGYFFKRQAAAKAGAVHVKTTLAPAVSEPEDDTIPSEIVAAITSAIAVTIDRRFRIHSVVVEEQPRDWAREGRRMIFASHKIR